MGFNSGFKGLRNFPDSHKCHQNKQFYYCLSGCTRRSLAKSDDTRGCICTICVVDLLMMSGLCSKHVKKF